MNITLDWIKKTHEYALKNQGKMIGQEFDFLMFLPEDTIIDENARQYMVDNRIKYIYQKYPDYNNYINYS